MRHKEDGQLLVALEVTGFVLWCESVTSEHMRGAESLTRNFFVSLFALFNFASWLVGWLASCP
jgi:hypothetical protein